MEKLSITTPLRSRSISELFHQIALKHLELAETLMPRPLSSSFAILRKDWDRAQAQLEKETQGHAQERQEMKFDAEKSERTQEEPLLEQNR
jgi:hypothetical protein